jgi:hypothetical protein
VLWVKSVELNLLLDCLKRSEQFSLRRLCLSKGRPLLEVIGALEADIVVDYNWMDGKCYLHSKESIEGYHPQIGRRSIFDRQV